MWQRRPAADEDENKKSGHKLHVLTVAEARRILGLKEDAYDSLLPNARDLFSGAGLVDSTAHPEDRVLTLAICDELVFHVCV